MCLYPKLIKNPKYKANKKNGGLIPAIPDERIQYVPIGCTQCMECRKQKAREWAVRLQEEIKENTNGKFITLTFSNEWIYKITYGYQTEKGELIKGIKEIYNSISGYELDNQIATRATRLFLERWRKKYKRSLRHWLVTELGHNGTENIHMHGIIWTNENLDEVEKIWSYGWIWKGKINGGQLENYVNNKTINYIIKYVNKIDDKHTTYKSIILTSPGIGQYYTKQHLGNWKKNKYVPRETVETYRTRTGNKLALPIYYRNKIYTEEEKEKLWIEKLDKNERWVLGNKISVKNGEEEYNRALKEAQKINKELGYGTGEKNWEQEKYERERRMLKQQQRIQNTCVPKGP